MQMTNEAAQDVFEQRKRTQSSPGHIAFWAGPLADGVTVMEISAESRTDEVRCRVRAAACMNHVTSTVHVHVIAPDSNFTVFLTGFTLSNMGQ